MKAQTRTGQISSLLRAVESLVLGVALGLSEEPIAGENSAHYSRKIGDEAASNGVA